MTLEAMTGQRRKKKTANVIEPFMQFLFFIFFPRTETVLTLPAMESSYT